MWTLKNPHDHGAGLRWTIDTEKDLEFAREVYARLYPGNPLFWIRRNAGQWVISERGNFIMAPVANGLVLASLAIIIHALFRFLGGKPNAEDHGARDTSRLRKSLKRTIKTCRRFTKGLKRLARGGRV